MKLRICFPTASSSAGSVLARSLKSLFGAGSGFGCFVGGLISLRMFGGSAIAVLIICLSFLFVDWLSYSNGDSFGHAQGDLPAPETAPCARVGDSRCNQWKNCPYKNLEFAGVNQVGDLRQLRAIGANGHDGIAGALVRDARALGCDGDHPAALRQHTPRALQRFTADAVEHHVHVLDDFFKSCRPVINHLVSSQKARETETTGRSRSDDVRAPPMRELHRETTDP